MRSMRPERPSGGEALVALLVGTAIAPPHILAFERAATAAITWLTASALRALVTPFVVVFSVFYVRTSAVFALVTRWCWHTALPP